MVPIFSKMWSVTLLNGSDVMTSAGSSGAGTRQRLACVGVRRGRGERIRGSLFFSFGMYRGAGAGRTFTLDHYGRGGGDRRADDHRAGALSGDTRARGRRGAETEAGSHPVRGTEGRGGERERPTLRRKGEKGSVGRASRPSRPPGIISDARERIGVDRAAHLRADIAIVRELVVERADGA